VLRKPSPHRPDKRKTTAQQTTCPACARGPKYASRQKTTQTAGVDFFITAQAVELLQEKPSWYDESVSGRLVGGVNTFGYAEGAPSRYTDPMGLWSVGDPLPQGLVDFSAGFGDGIISTLSIGFLSGQSLRDNLGIGSVNFCSNIYSGGRVAGTALTLLANAGGAVPKSLTHFTTTAGARGIAKGGIKASSHGLFGGGRYASSIGPFPRNLFVPPRSKVGISINNTDGYIRTVPGTFLNPTTSGAAQLGAMNAAYGAVANRDALDQKCGCQN
jgi:hypothetical protein